MACILHSSTRHHCSGRSVAAVWHMWPVNRSNVLFKLAMIARQPFWWQNRHERVARLSIKNGNRAKLLHRRARGPRNMWWYSCWDGNQGRRESVALVRLILCDIVRSELCDIPCDIPIGNRTAASMRQARAKGMIKTNNFIVMESYDIQVKLRMSIGPFIWRGKLWNWKQPWIHWLREQCSHTQVVCEPFEEDDITTFDWFELNAPRL